MDENNYCVYMHITPNNKRYIGITKQKVNRRWRNGKGYKGNEHFTYAIEKYGWDNIKHEILEKNLTYIEACEKEILYISKYNSANRKYGYNIEKGGFACKELSKETKQKISNANKGRKHTQEFKDKISELNKGEKNWWYGKHLTDKQKQIISEKNSKKIIAYNLDGTFYKIYSSISKAAEELGCKSHSSIGNVLDKNNYQSCNFMWRRYINEYPLSISPFQPKEKPKYYGKYNHNAKRVAQLDDNNEIIKIWDTLKEASNYYNKSNTSLTNALKRGHKFAGYKWKYV